MKKYLCICVLCCFCASATVLYAQDERDRFIEQAKTYIGTPYKYGGSSRNGIDCSGFIYIVALESINLKLPRTVADLIVYAKKIPNPAMQPGDIVFFNTVANKPSHVGIYLGNSQFIHSASDGPNTGVIISSLNESYWSKTYIGAGQIIGSDYTGPIIDNTAGIENIQKPATPIDISNVFSSFSLANVKFEISSSMIWNFSPANSFFFNIRGGTIQIHSFYDFGGLNPGIGIEIRFDPQLNITQIPLLFSLTVGKKGLTRFFIGPVFTIGEPTALGTNPSLGKVPIFPGIIGFEWQTPPLLTYKSIAFSLYQNASYTVFTDSNANALPFTAGLATGFLLSSGIRITF